uniref:Uncharacterized protein n=2 Tax=Aegilops tauschii subsp. strangulata TaxID=200361 RepID=A0A453NRD8_AEGTS
QLRHSHHPVPSPPLPRPSLRSPREPASRRPTLSLPPSTARLRHAIPICSSPARATEHDSVARLNGGELGDCGAGVINKLCKRRALAEMDAVVDVADAMGAVTIENGAKLELPDGVEERGEEHDAQANRDHSGESEVINPHEEAGGEASSHPEGRKIGRSKGTASHGPKVAKTRSPKSGDEGLARRGTPSSSLRKAPIVRVSHADSGTGSCTNGDPSVDKKKSGKIESRPSAKETSLLEDAKSREGSKAQKQSDQHSSIRRDEEDLNSESSKARRSGSTPAYGFSFKCDERAEKRREVISGLIPYFPDFIWRKKKQI